MLFNSFEFFIFFPTVVAVYFAIPHRARTLWLLAASFADKLERKWIICGACAAIIVFGTAFSQLTEPALLILSGVLLTAANMTMSYAYHAYQTEVFPTAIRATGRGLGTRPVRFVATP